MKDFVLKEVDGFFEDSIRGYFFFVFYIFVYVCI